MRVSSETIAHATENLTDHWGRPFSSFKKTIVFSANKLPGRERHKTNQGAYQEFAQNRNSVHQLIALLRTGYPQEQLPIDELTDFARTLYVFPLYLRLRAENPVDIHGVPPSVIDMSRAAAGIIPLGSKMNADPAISDTVSVDEFYDYANGNNPYKKNYFVAEEDDPQSCPAPEKSVKAILHAMMYPRSERVISSPDWEAYVTEKDAHRSVIFGPSLIEYLQGMHRLNSESSLTRDERTKLHTQLGYHKKVIHQALGYSLPVTPQN